MPQDGGTDRNRLNLGRLSNQIGAWVGLSVGLAITLVVVVTGLLVPWHSKATSFVFIVLGFFLLVGVLMSVGGLTSVRQLRRPGNVPAGVSQFANAVQWNVKATLPPATAATGEKVVDWMAPILMLGWGFSNRATIVVNRETDHNPFNTLLVTTSQVIGILLTPEDLSGVEGGPVRGALTTMINQSTASTHDKIVQFDMVNRSRWDQIVASATSQGLEAVLADHVNFGLPYTEVQSFSVSHSWINPGIKFKLRDGRKMKCAALASKQIDHVAESLSQYLTKV